MRPFSPRAITSGGTGASGSSLLALPGFAATRAFTAAGFAWPANANAGHRQQDDQPESRALLLDATVHRPIVIFSASAIVASASGLRM